MDKYFTSIQWCAWLDNACLTILIFDLPNISELIWYHHNRLSNLTQFNNIKQAGFWVSLRYEYLNALIFFYSLSLQNHIMR